MARSFWHAPENYTSVDSTVVLPPSKWSKLKAALPALFAGLLALVLAGCAVQRLPVGIQPSQQGNFLLSVSPSDAEVVVVEEGFETTGIPPRGTAAADGSGELRFDLQPGRYKVVVMKAGYFTVEELVEIAATGTAGDDDGAGVSLAVVLEIDPDADGGAEEDSDESSGSDGSGSGSPAVRSDFSLTGNPDFDVDRLTSEQRLWYERMWAATRNPDSDLDPDRMAASDDVYVYSRDLHTHLQTLLIVFRATGDLALLDEVDRLAEIMRGELRDAWTGTLDGTDGTTDGHLGWAHRMGSYPEFEGKDIHETNDVKTHAIVAGFAYALDLNRDLASPSGRDYGKHADFWKGYLVNDFEAKWRERKRKPTGFPVLMRPHTHTYMSGLKYHYYMYKLTGVEGYLDEAERNSRILWDNEIKKTSVGSDSGYVWARSVLSEGGGENYLHPTTYARYFHTDAIEMYLEGFDRWADAGNMPRFANPVAEWVIDVDGAETGRDWFARDIGGGKTRAGIPSDGDWKRLNTLGFSWSPYTLLAPWDDSGRIADISVDALRDLGKLNTPGAVYIPAGMFLAEWMNGS
ncbi:MAG: hypothetical protein WD314_04895 [Trueperaceae bacterium]